MLLNVKESCGALGLHAPLFERGMVLLSLFSPIICGHLHFIDEGLKDPTCALHLLSYLYLKLGVKPFGPS